MSFSIRDHMTEEEARGILVALGMGGQEAEDYAEGLAASDDFEEAQEGERVLLALDTMDGVEDSRIADLAFDLDLED